MSLISTVSNYGGRQPNNTSYIKQFVESTSNFVMWIFKKNNGITYIEPSNTTKPIRIPQNVIINGDLTVYGIFNNPSDEIIKKNIVSLSTTSISKNILNLNPCQYQYKNQNENDEKYHYGLIAQEVEINFPELIGHTQYEDKIIKTVNYLEIIPLLLHEIKILQEEVNELKSKI